MTDRLTQAHIDAALAEIAKETPACVILPVPDLPTTQACVDWGLSEARDLAQVGAIRNDELTIETVGNLLRFLAEWPLPADFAWRFLVVSGVDQPILPVNVGFAAATGDAVTSWNAMSGTDSPAPAGRHVADFELGGVSGQHCLRFELRPLSTGNKADSEELWVTAGICCRRDLPHVGLTDVLAAVDTPYVDLLLGVLPCLYDLVTGGYLGDIVAQALVAHS